MLSFFPYLHGAGFESDLKCAQFRIGTDKDSRAKKDDLCLHHNVNESSSLLYQHRHSSLQQ